MIAHYDTLFSDQQRQRVAAALTGRGADGPCHRCGHPRATISDGYLKLRLHLELDTGVLAGPALAATIVICDHCGHLDLHALDRLGALP